MLPYEYIHFTNASTVDNRLHNRTITEHEMSNSLCRYKLTKYFFFHQYRSFTLDYTTHFVSAIYVTLSFYKMAQTRTRCVDYLPCVTACRWLFSQTVLLAKKINQLWDFIKTFEFHKLSTLEVSEGSSCSTFCVYLGGFDLLWYFIFLLLPTSLSFESSKKNNFSSFLKR